MTDRIGTLARSSTPWGFPALYLGVPVLDPIFGSNTSVWEGTNLILFLFVSIRLLSECCCTQ